MPLYISYYEALGIDKNASPKDIHKAYGKFMQRHHPDKNSGIPADEQFYNVQNAYKILSDPAKREAYDTFELNASTLPSFTPHSLQPHIKQQLRTLNAHIYTLNTQTIPWFCYNRAIFLRALEQIHVKSSLFLYGFLTGNDVLLIQAFLNHTLAMLDNLQKALEIEDKFKIILNYVTAIQEDEQAQALKELYELQIDAILEAHLAIISKEAPPLYRVQSSPF